MIKRILKNIIRRTGYRISSTKYLLKQLNYPENILELNFDHVMSDYLIHRKNGDDSFTFIQVGAFDGVECDPLIKYLNRYRWNGVMLEPQPGPYSKLKERYSDQSQISVRNSAVSFENGKKKLYTLEGGDLPEWAKGMASFNKNIILKHRYLFPAINDYIKETDIDTVTFQKLLDEEAIITLDLLQIDTEGYDAEILKMFPFDRIRPNLIHFESKHIAKNDLEFLLDTLIGKGYRIARDGEEDMIAVLEEKQAN